MSGQPPASGVVNVVGDVVQHVASGSETSCELSALGCSKENIDINILSPSKVPVSYRYDEAEVVTVFDFLFSSPFSVFPRKRKKVLFPRGRSQNLI